MASTEKPGQPVRGQPLDVHVRLVVGGGDTEARSATVQCPLREGSMALEQCMQCERCAGLYFEPDQGSRILCGWSPDHGLPSSTLLPKHWRAGDEASTTTPISALLGREVVCVRPEMRVEELSALLLDRSFSGVPVVDEAGRPIGVVSRSDVLESSREDARATNLDRRAAEDAWEYDAGLAASQRSRRPPRTVAEIMTPIVLVLDEGASVAHAAALMAYEGVHRLPVVSETQEVVGVLSTLDILRWIAQRSGYLVSGTPQSQRS